MADYYRNDRGGGGRGGGGGGGGGNYHKKRRYHEEDERDYRQQRPRHEDPAAKLRKEVLAIAESPLIKIEDSVRNIAKLFIKNYESTNIRSSFISLLKKLVVEQPFKIPFVAAIVLVANAEKEEVGKLVIEEFTTLAQGYLDECEWRPFKLVLRFLTCLSSMMAGDGVTPFLDEFVKYAASLSSGGSKNGIVEELSKIILLAIPYLMSSAPGKVTPDYARLLVKKVAGIPVHPPLESFLGPYFGENAPYPTSTTNKLLIQQLQTEGENGWKFAVLPRPWETFRETLEASTKHEFAGLKLPTEPKSVTVYPTMYFSVFANQEAETVPANTDVSFSILRDTITDTINLLDFNRMSVARFLVDLDCYFAHEAFVKRGTAYDRIKEMAGGDKSTWKPEDIVVDVVFSLIYQLPQPEHKLVYYHAVLTEVCKLAPQAVAPSLGRSIRFLYRHLDTMDVELRYRFIDWFAHHLSNFGFTWKWMEWSGDLELPLVHPKRSFIGEALEKEIRLSFANRVKGTLPDAYNELVPAEKLADLPEFKYNNEETPFSAQGKEMLALLKKRAPDEEVNTLLATIAESAGGSTSPGLEIYITSVCHIGAKSLSHVLSCIDRCKNQLAALGDASPTSRREIVGSVMSYWRLQPGIGANVVDKLLNYSVLTPISVVEWVLIDAGRTALPRGHAWEMVSTTIRKVISRTKNLVTAVKATTDPEQCKILVDTLQVASGDQNALLDCIVNNLGEETKHENGQANEKPDEEMLQWWSKCWFRALRRRFFVDEVEIPLEIFELEVKAEVKEETMIDA